MPLLHIPRPDPGEYAPGLAHYIEQVPDGHILAVLEAQITEREPLLRGLSDDVARRRYAPGKWSLKEVLGHITDGERVFAYRALTFARGDPGPLPSFDEDAWVRVAGFDDVPLDALLDDFVRVRHETVRFFRRLGPEALARMGTASDRRMSVASIAFILAGHEQHHMRVIRERYLGGGAC